MTCTVTHDPRLHDIDLLLAWCLNRHHLASDEVARPVTCALIHDRAYVDACTAWGDAYFDAAMDPTDRENIEADCRAFTWEREVFHGAGTVDDFCFDFECDQWGKVNRWSERILRGW